MTRKSFAGLPTPAYLRPYLATAGLLVFLRSLPVLYFFKR